MLPRHIGSFSGTNPLTACYSDPLAKELIQVTSVTCVVYLGKTVTSWIFHLFMHCRCISNGFEVGCRELLFQELVFRRFTGFGSENSCFRQLLVQVDSDGWLCTENCGFRCLGSSGLGVRKQLRNCKERVRTLSSNSEEIVKKLVGNWEETEIVRN